MSLWTKLRTNPRIVDKSPIIAVLLLELANLQQLQYMWTHWTAAGQSLTGWLTVQAALWVWLNFYLVFNKQNRFAIWGTIVGIVMNACVCVTVLLFRYVL